MARRSESEVPSSKEPFKEAPDHKKVWVELLEDPELGFVLKSSSYEKALVILSYKILKELEKLNHKS